MQANIDRWIRCPERGLGVAELKTVSVFRRDDWEDGPPV